MNCMLRRLVALLPCVPCLANLSCDTSMVVQELPGTVIYSNSFESSADTVGWITQGALEFRVDVPPGGGTQSVYVAGGCLAPTAWVDLNPLDQDSRLLLRCWGKSLVGGGSVMLDRSGEFSQGIQIGIGDSAWTSYASRDTLFCPANIPMRLSVLSGGIIFNSMLVDRLEIVRVE